jgi:probable HAF family extracellular repeat protein
VNDAGAVVGRSQTPEDVNFATIWFPGEDPLALADVESNATDVNEAGDVVGEIIDREGFGVATIWPGAVPGGSPLESLGGCTLAVDINNTGLVVGQSGLGHDKKKEFPTHAVVWDGATRKVIAEIVPFGGADFDSFAAGVNDAGVVVGMADNDVNEKQGFIWDEVNGMRNLNDLVDFPLVIREARAISETGWIAVRVVENGNERANVLKPLNGCAADVNGDGALNILDFVAFQVLFVDGDPVADCNGDNVFNILDFVCYQGVFLKGCP